MDSRLERIRHDRDILAVSCLEVIAPGFGRTRAVRIAG